METQAADKRMLEREALRSMIQQWNANRLDLFELSEPNENLEFHGVMRFYFQDSGQKIATKCIRVASDATVSDVIETLIEKFRPDMRMLSLGSYVLYEVHAPHEERRLAAGEKPLLVQLNWHADDREGRFLLRCQDHNGMPLGGTADTSNQNFKRKLSKREKKELKKKEKLSRLKSDATNDENRPAAEKLYTELPETSFTRSISNPEAVMRRRRQQKLERKLQQFRSKDGGPDTGGTLKIYGESLCPDVPYKTLLVAVGDCAAAVVREMLDKYGLRADPHHYCLVQVNMQDNSEYILDDDECPLAIVMTHPHRGSIMFHVRRRPADCQPRRRKKKAGGGGATLRPGNEPLLLETTPDGAPLDNGRRVRLNDVVEVGSGNGTTLQLYGPSIQPRHCVVASVDGGVAVTPLHTDAHVYVDGQRVQHTQLLQHGSLVKFGRVSTFRFIDPAQENKLSRNFSQSQHFDSASVYDRSPTSPIPDNASGVISQASPSIHSQMDSTNGNTTGNTDYQRTMSPISTNTINNDTFNNYNNKDLSDSLSPLNNNTLKLDNESAMLSPHADECKEDAMRDENLGSAYNDRDTQSDHQHQQQTATLNRATNNQFKDNYETTFDLEGNVETKSICSAKSGGSGQENRVAGNGNLARGSGQEAILPAVLEFPEHGQQQFLAAVVSRLDVHAPSFKLAPVYTLYLCARYRASTHYRPELTPTERAHKLTTLMHHVANLIHSTVQEKYPDAAAQAFWMANSSELLHFLKCDRHVCSFSTHAQERLAAAVQAAFSNLVTCYQSELSAALMCLGGAGGSDADLEAAVAPTLHILAASMALLRVCRVNAALTIQLFSHLFHYINAWCFNKLMSDPSLCTSRWGRVLGSRVGAVGAWAERQGLEVSADCHLARVHQAAHLLQAPKNTAEEMSVAVGACFKLNSAQVAQLLSAWRGDTGNGLAPELLDLAVRRARAVADELYKSDGREITLEENPSLGVSLLIPGDGFSGEVVRGVPPGLADFLAPLQRAGLCRLAAQPHSQGNWTVYMNGYHGSGVAVRRAQEPQVQVIQLHKNSNGMGLSIVAAKGAGQSRLGIYIKSVVAGGAAAADGRLQAGDQLLSVDGHSLVGITQEKAAEFLVRTGPSVALEVAKQGAVLHGLATLLQQPSPRAHTGPRRASERDLPSRVQAEGAHVKPSKSVPTLHEPARHHDIFNPGYSRTSSSNSIPTLAGAKSKSSHNLSSPLSPSSDQGFYQNVGAARHAHNLLGDRSSTLRSSQNALQLSGGVARPQSAHYAAAPAPAPAPVPAPSSPPPSLRAAHSARDLAAAPHNATTSHLHHTQMGGVGAYPSMPNVSAEAGNAGNAGLSLLRAAGQHSLRGQAKLQEMQEEVLRRHQRATQQNNLHNRYEHEHEHEHEHSIQQGGYSRSNGAMSPTSNYVVSPSSVISTHVMSPNSAKHQPPVAPKPQSARRALSGELEMPLLPPAQTHPHKQSHTNSEDELGSVAVAQQGPGQGPSGNPWQREEREREAEARVRSARARRDAAIAALVALGGARTPQQHQQLRALQLERDFQRRAADHLQDDDDCLPAPACSSLVTSLTPVSVASSARPPHDDPPPTAPPPLPPQPKSILKSTPGPPHPPLSPHTPNSPPKAPKSATFSPTSTLADEREQIHRHDRQEQNIMSQFDPNVPMYGERYQPRELNLANMQGLSKYDPNIPTEEMQERMLHDIANMHITSDARYEYSQNKSGEEEPAIAPATAPPPPERGSSFAVMSHAQSLHSNLSTLSLRDKRVSFHDRDLQQSNDSDNTHTQREDPDRFIAEAESMLQSPTTPTTPTMPLGHAHTPGVIGAQEVYRDPRTRRLLEQQRAAQASGEPIPEKLSFKEKMKMFALESGEGNTPKDKVKISRAQRDIDAVH